MKSVETTLQQRMDAVRGNQYFDDLSESMLKEIAEHTRLGEFQRGDVLFWEGDDCEGLFILEQGSAKIFRLSPQGRQYIVRILQEGDTFAEVPAFDEGTSPVNVEALETCRVWVIDKNKLHELVMKHPTFAQKALVNFGKMLRGMVRMVSEMAFYQVTHRLARLISEISMDKSAPHWTQEQLAARLGTVREVVARSLKELERSGAIKVEDRRIQIVDKEIFEQWMQPN
ncbi:MAG: Crp/Fnr family transcriptional regulator [Anaerolineales bacterium]|uniref:Crp/Fnr family transcriptional regulator n=1 Tax=Candidatus Villigracilis vicinus TaxID=3140679 RepID=UPI0031346855|nr:Crp/Fnr family transcriptional regulator [Anaerolineales bacterium]